MGPGLGSEDGGEGGNGGGEQSQAVGEAKEREGIVTIQGNPVKYSFFFQEKEAKRCETLQGLRGLEEEGTCENQVDAFVVGME